MTQWTPEQLKDHFGDREFRGSDLSAYLHLDDFRSSGSIIKQLKRDHLITQTIKGWRFGNGTEPHADLTASAVLESTPTIIKVHRYYINPSAILIVDTLQADKIVIHTSVLEIDGETKHPRNKRLIFTKQHALDEYQAIMGWLCANSNTPPTAPEDAQAALQLAEEATARLTEAHKEIASLKAKIAQFRALLGDAS